MVTLAEKETETTEIKYTSYLDIYWLTYTPHLFFRRDFRWVLRVAKMLG